MQSKFYCLFLLSFLTIQVGFSQEYQQTIRSPHPESDGVFGQQIILDKNTLIISDENAYNPEGTNCGSRKGIVTIYKKNVKKEWVLAQELKPLEMQDTHFGISIFLRKNMLAVISGYERESRSAVYLFTRKDSLSNFEFKTKIDGYIPGRGFIFFQKVTMNDQYLVVNEFTPYFYIYDIVKDTILNKRVFYPGGTEPWVENMQLTDNNTLVVHYAFNSLEHYKIKSDTVIKTFESVNSDTNYYYNMAVSGNTVIHEVANHLAAQSKFAIMKIDEEGMHKASADTIVVPGMSFHATELKEDSFLFISNLVNASPELLTYKYNGSNYVTEDKLSLSKNAGWDLKYSRGLLAVSDYDSSSIKPNPLYCSNPAYIGKIHLYSTGDDKVITSLNVSESLSVPLISPNPTTGGWVSVNLENSLSAEIINCNGVMVKNTEILSNQINVDGLVKGVYLLKVTGKEIVHTTRLVII